MRFFLLLSLPFLYYFFTLLQVVQCGDSNQRETIDFIYSPFYQQKYDIKDPQGASTKIKVAEKANLVFVSAGFGGVIIIDGATNKIIFEQKADEFLFTLEATSDGEYLMVSNQAKFSIFQFVNRKTLKLLSQAEFPTSIIDMFIDSKETTVYAVGLQGQLVAYNILKKNAVEPIGFFNAQSNIIHQGQITNDGKWILLGNDLLGLTVLSVKKNLDDDSQEFELVGQGIMVWKTWAAVITNDNQYVYALDNWNGLFIYDFNQILSASPHSYPISITFTAYWPFKEINPSVYSLKLSNDNNYLLIGVRSQGVYIFNIKDRLNPSFFQGIPVGAHAFSVALSPDENYLYYANAQSIYIFGRTPPNLNNNYPNLFNTHQSSIQDTSPAFYKWRCYTRNIQDKTYFFGPFDAMGIGILDCTDPYKMSSVYAFQYQAASLVNSLEISQDNRYLYVPIQEDDTCIQVLDISDVDHPIEVFRLIMPNPNHGEALFFSKDYQYMVCSYDNGVLLIDASQPPKLILLDYWKVLPYMTGENAGVMITNDNQYVIGSVRGYGIYVLDASDKLNLSLKNSLQTLGAEGLIPSLYDSKYAYIYDGFKGVAILDLTVLPELKILSRISLQGWSNTLIPIQNDSYLIVAQMEAGMVTLIDIKDKAKPKIISTYQYQSQSAQSICFSPDQEYTFINNNLGTIVLPMRSKVQIHTEVQQIDTSEEGIQTLVTLSKDDFLKVGQKVQFNFVPLYPQERMSIVSVSYYEQEQTKALPFWMKYDSNKRNLLIEVDKSALDEERVNANLNTILLKVTIPLDSGNFLYDQVDVKTTEAQSEQIFSYLQEQKILDSSGLVTELFDPTQPINFDLKDIPPSQRLFDEVRLTLQRGIYINPVVFYVQPSLSLDVTDLVSPIKTLADNVQLYLLVEEQYGKFVMINFPGVIASTTDAQNQLKLEGSLINLNRVLSQKVIFANSQNINQMMVKISLIDGVNYQVTQNKLISECTFIKLKLQLEKNPDLPLQKQFNKLYKNSEINIQEEFSIDFSAQSFIVGDIQSITYKAQILQANEYEDLTPDNWIQFQTTSGSINFHGTPPVSALNNIYSLRIIATDGYTEDYDDFSINASGLPFLYVFNLLIKIFGPIFAVLGVYKYKSLILNSVYRNVVMFATETAVRGQLYKKKITVLGDEMEKSKLLFEGFLAKFSSDRAKFREETEHVKNILQRYGSDVAVEQVDGDDEKRKKYNQASDLRLTKDKSDKLAQSGLDYGTQDVGDFSKPRRLKVISNYKREDNVKLQNSIQIIQMSPKNSRSTPLEREYLKKDGSVSLSKLLRDISHKNITFTLTGRKYTAKNFITDFKNPDSRIYKGLKALASRHFLRFDVRSQEVYNYLKYHAQNFLNYTKNDWYRGLVKIIATDAKDCYGFPVPFPELQLKEEQINLILIDLQIHNQIGQPFEQLGEFDINYNLIREVLFADALGLVEYTPSIFSPCVGESIHLHSYEIGSVEAFKQVKNAWCMNLRKLLNFEYMNYGMSKNMTLPNWIEFDHKNGVITLQGVPQSQDVEDLLIRIIDVDQFVIKQYHFKIVDEYYDPLDGLDYQINDSIADDQSIQINQQSIYNQSSRRRSKNQITPNSMRAVDSSQNQLMNKIKLNDESNYSIFKKQVKYVDYKQNDQSLQEISEIFKQNDYQSATTNHSPKNKLKTKQNNQQNEPTNNNNQIQFSKNVNQNNYDQNQENNVTSMNIMNGNSIGTTQIFTNKQNSIESNLSKIKERAISITQKEDKDNLQYFQINLQNSSIMNSQNFQDVNETTKRGEETSRQFIQKLGQKYDEQDENISSQTNKNYEYNQPEEGENSTIQHKNINDENIMHPDVDNEQDEEITNNLSCKNINKEVISNVQTSKYFSKTTTKKS